VIAGSEYRNVHDGTGIEQYYWLPEDREAGIHARHLLTGPALLSSMG
jgi:hypothetical protein